MNNPEYYIFIGKDNKARWESLKIKYNFSCDSGFISYLLDLLPNKNSNSLKIRSADEEITQPISSTSNPAIVNDEETLFNSEATLETSWQIEHCSEASSKIDKTVENCCKSDSILETISNKDDSCSSVIVTHNASKTDDDSEESGFHTDSQEEVGLQTNALLKVQEELLLKRQDASPCLELTEDQCVQNRINEKTKSSKDKTSFKAKAGKCKEMLVSQEETNTTSYKKKKLIVNTGNNKEAKHEELIPNIEPEHVNNVVNINSDSKKDVRAYLCEDCDLSHIHNSCPFRTPASQVLDSATSEDAGISGKSYAEVTLPTCLELRDDGVVTKQPLAAFVQFGPLVGQEISEREIPDDSTMEHIWELSSNNKCRYLSTRDAAHSNWLRYVRPAPVHFARNVEVILRDYQLFFVTTTTLSAGEELLFWARNNNPAWSHKKLSKTKCGGCNLSFSHTLYYRLHCAVFHDPAYSLTVRKYHCKVCGLAVLGKDNIVKHAANNHNGKGAYQCQFCHKFFLRLNYLEMHRTYGCSANPNRSRPLCDYCGRKFCQPQKLKVHIKRMHSEMLDVLRDFQCKHCMKVLGSRPALQRHVREVHQKDVVGASTCDRCGKMFQNKSNLKIHMLTHSGVKPFKCKDAECQAAFTTKQCLQFHYRKVHGLEAGRMPHIERSVEYTFDAYSGSRRPNSVNTDSQCSSDGEDTPDKCREEESSMSPPISVTGDPIDSLPTRTVVSKGSKKWMGEDSTTVFDFDEDDKDQDINVSNIEDDEPPMPLLLHQCKPDSSNASLLVEAALDAAERDIDIPAKVTSPISLVTSKEPYSSICQSPLSLSRPDTPQLHMESCYSTSISPRHPYSFMFPERTPHYDFRLSPPPNQMEAFHLDESGYDLHRRIEDNSGDEGLLEAQNLSLGLKNKPLQLEIPYKYDTMEERSFESIEGLDMSRTGGYHHPFVSVAARYPHTLYEPRTYSHTDVLRVVNFSHSVDLSLPRPHHHPLTPPVTQSMIEPPPPPYQTYPLSTSPYNRPSLSPTYHHYSATY